MKKAFVFYTEIFVRTILTRQTSLMVTMAFLILCQPIFVCNANAQALVAPLASGEKKLQHHVPPAVMNMSAKGSMDPKQNLVLAIGLPLHNEEQLNQLTKDLYDPASPSYHHYLSTAEFTARFGATQQEYDSVIQFAQSNNFKILGTHTNRLVLDLEGSVADIQRTFKINLKTYRHPTENRDFYSPDTDPIIPGTLAIIQISGLHNYSLPKPHYKKLTAAHTSGIQSHGGSGPVISGLATYIGKDFRNAYLTGATNLTGAGQSVGLLQFDSYYPADIAAYTNTAGIHPSTVLSNVIINTGANTPSSGNGEVSLDITMCMAMAPGLSKIYVYMATNPTPWPTILSRMANDNLSKQLSCSWGENSPSTPDVSSENIFKQMVTQGQCFFNATGDSDAFSGGVPFPSEGTNIVQVGATTLTTGSGAVFSSETAWNWGGGTGTSGGISANFAIPPFQQGISMTAAHGSTSFRNTPDVALTGDNVYNVADNGTPGSVGGTSCAAPLWAGFMALVNEQAATSGVSSPGYINSAIYTIAKSTNYAAAFHDVTKGNNFRTGSTTLFAATNGYDLCTGLGTPFGAGLINLLVPVVTTNPPTITTQPLSQTQSYGGSAMFSVVASGTSPLSYAWRLNSTPLPFATNSSLTVSPLDPTNAGNYSVVITNAYGSVTSSVAVLTVISSPSIAQQPTNVTVFNGQSFNLYATGSGYSPLAYQWRLGGTNILGANTNVYAVPSAGAADAGNYVLVVTNAYGSVTSSVAVVTVISLPTILQQPASTSVLIGQPFSLNVTANGAHPLLYQWRKGGISIVGANTNTYSVALSQVGDSANYDVVISNSYGSVTSSVAQVTISQPAAYSGILAGWDASTQPGGNTNFGSTTLTPATNAPNVIVTGFTRGSGVTQSGTGARRGWGGTGWTNTTAASAFAGGRYVTFSIAASNGYTLSFSNISQFNYRRSSAGSTSGTIRYQIGAASPVDISTVSYSSTSSSGSSIASILLTGITDLQNVPAGTNVTFYIVNYGGTNSSGTWYIFDTAGSTSDDFEITGSLSPQAASVTSPTIATNPPPITVLNGKNAALAAAVSGTAPLYYQWYRGALALSNGLNLDGSFSNALSFTPAYLSNSGTYSLVVSNAGGSVTSTPAALTVLAVPSVNVSNIQTNITTLFASGAVPNSGYVLQMTTNLLPPVQWSTRFSGNADSTGNITFTDTNYLPVRFYRIQYP